MSQSQKSTSRGPSRPSKRSMSDDDQQTSDDTERLRYPAGDHLSSGANGGHGSRGDRVSRVLAPATKRIRRWYAMQASRLSDVVHSRVLSTLSVSFSFFLFPPSGRVVFAFLSVFSCCCVKLPSVSRSDLMVMLPRFSTENHDGAPAATATSPLSKRKVFGG